MPEEKLTRKERKEALITAALNRLDTPWKYQEFVCPCCSGIASVIDREEIIKAECHACSSMGRYAVSPDALEGAKNYEEHVIPVVNK